MSKVSKHVLALAVAATSSTAALAQSGGDWHYGIGTGLSSFSLDGDLGFATPGGGLVSSIDLSNSDTADLVDSAIGANAFATNGQWNIQLSYATVSLEDSDADLRAKWDRTNAELAVVYNFAQTGSSTWGVLGGVRYTDHDWEISSRGNSFADVKPGDDWTDFIVGFSHVLTISESWSWRNRVDGGFGDTEKAWFASTGIFWKPLDHWLFSLNARYLTTEFGDKNDVNKPDFYYYDVDEVAYGLGVSYVW